MFTGKSTDSEVNTPKNLAQNLIHITDLMTNPETRKYALINSVLLLACVIIRGQKRLTVTTMQWPSYKRKQFENQLGI